jgi:hypothetical protein
MRWFGESWGAPVCHPIDHVDTPVDMQCGFCPRTIDEDDQGFEMPHLASDGELAVLYAHRDCLLRAILPHGFKESLERQPPV